MNQNQNIKLAILENKTFPNVPDTQACHNCKSTFKVVDLVNCRYLANCCNQPAFPVKYARKEVFVEQEQQQIAENTQLAQHQLAMRYEDRGYDSSIESGKGKNAYKIYYNPDDPEQSKQRLLVAAFLKQFQEHIDNLDLIRLFVAKGFDVSKILEQIQVELKPKPKEVMK